MQNVLSKWWFSRSHPHRQPHSVASLKNHVPVEASVMLEPTLIPQGEVLALWGTSRVDVRLAVHRCELL